MQPTRPYRFMHLALRRVLHASSILAFAALVSSAQAASLPAYNADPGSVSISGLSSGGYMAAQLGVAYSGTFTAGFGVFAGGPYDCARNQSYTACMYNATPSISTPTSNMSSWSGNQIDSTANLANRKIYLWTGTSDTTVGVNVMNQLKSQLGNFDTASNVKYDQLSGAVHTFPTDFNGAGDNSCTSSASPYISNCSFDGAGAALKWMYGGLTARNTGTLGGQVVAFDQTQFIAAGNGMDSTGYLYVPANCASGQACKLHVALHGCLQSHNNIGSQFINNTGYNMWADTNNIIILYPQALPDNTSHSTPGNGSLANPNGCYDWVGWYGGNYDQKGGAQMAGIVRMVQQIISGWKGGGGGGLPAPTGLTVTGVTNNTVSLSWNQVSGAASYNVYRNGGKVNSSALTATSYTDSGLTSGASYSYNVAAVDGTGKVGAQSSTVSATTTGYQPSCYTASNYAQVQAGRAYQNMGNTYANGSNQAMGLYNTFYTHTLKETSANYYIIADSGCP